MSKSTLNLGGGKDAMIAVLRASGAISQGRDRGMGGSVKSDSFIDKIRFVRGARSCSVGTFGTLVRWTEGPCCPRRTASQERCGSQVLLFSLCAGTL